MTSGPFGPPPNTPLVRHPRQQRTSASQSLRDVILDVIVIVFVVDVDVVVVVEDVVRIFVVVVSINVVVVVVNDIFDDKFVFVALCVVHIRADVVVDDVIVIAFLRDRQNSGVPVERSQLPKEELFLLLL